MDLGQAASGVPAAEGAATAAAQGATSKADEQLARAAACKAYRDVCGNAPDVGYKPHYDVMQVIVRGAYASAEAELAQMATAKAPQQWPQLQRRQMARQQTTAAAQQPVAKTTQMLQPRTDSQLAQMRAHDPRYVAARAEASSRPMTAHSFVIPPSYTMPSTQHPSRPIMPSVEAGAHAAARRHTARGGHVTTYGSNQDVAVFVPGTIASHFV